MRERPLPYLSQVLQSLSMLALLQELHQLGQDAQPPRQLIVVTTTLARTFQKLHMMGHINSLRSARCPLHWVVVEGGRASEETASLLRGSGLPHVHLAAGSSKDAERWQGREILEYSLRLHGLRCTICMTDLWAPAVQALGCTEVLAASIALPFSPRSIDRS